MHSNKVIQDELYELSPFLAGIPNKNVFTVPEGYFEILPNEFLLKVVSLKMSVPEGYFDGLAENILSRIKLNTVPNNIYAVEPEYTELLAPVKHINVYKVAADYFEQLAPAILKKIPQPAPIIAMNKRSSFFNYAAAAVITGILGLSVFTAFDKKAPVKSLQLR